MSAIDASDLTKRTGFLPPLAERQRGKMSASGPARVADRWGSFENKEGK